MAEAHTGEMEVKRQVASVVVRGRPEISRVVLAERTAYDAAADCSDEAGGGEKAGRRRRRRAR